MTNNTSVKRTFTLTELGESIQSVIDGAYNKTYWVKAEIVKLNFYPKSGHCYPDLVDKVNNQIKSQFRGFIWGKDYQRIQKEFLDKCQSDLKSGMKVLMQVKVQFHALHGLSLQIQDIDANYTIGEMALNRAKTIKTLKSEGLFYNNTLLEFPLLPKRIAVISVETSKGYQDFMNIVQASPYAIDTTLFPALLQGDQAIDSIRHQLKKIKERHFYFDTIAIIRGGGGEIGLDCYDAYTLAKEITTFQVPVLAGIGHAANVTVTEMVAHKHFITPTDLAYFIVGKFDIQKDIIKSIKTDFNEGVKAYLQGGKQELNQISGAIKPIVHKIIHKKKLELNTLGFQIKEGSGQRLWFEKSKLSKMNQRLQLNTKALVEQERWSLKQMSDQLNQNARQEIDHQKQELKSIKTILRLMNPEQILKRGYSLQYNRKGKIITSSKQIKSGEVLTTQFKDGNITSIVE